MASISHGDIRRWVMSKHQFRRLIRIWHLRRIRDIDRRTIIIHELFQKLPTHPSTNPSSVSIDPMHLMPLTSLHCETGCRSSFLISSVRFITLYRLDIWTCCTSTCYVLFQVLSSRFAWIRRIAFFVSLLVSPRSSIYTVWSMMIPCSSSVFVCFDLIVYFIPM